MQFTCNAVNTHLNHRRIFLFYAPCGMGSLFCACEILIANLIDWLFAACLEYFIFFSIDSSEARKQYDEYCVNHANNNVMHMTERIFNALHTQTFDPLFVHWRLI